MTARCSARSQPRILTVTELAAGVRGMLDEVVGPVWVAGELSGVRQSSARHLYFTLKDRQCQLSAVMFWRAAQTLPFDLAEGLDVVVHGRLELYTARGALQLVVERMEPQGLANARCHDSRARSASSRRCPAPRFTTC